MASTDITDTLVVGHRDRDAVRLMNGAKMLVRGASVTCGAGFLLAAVGIWLWPGSSWAADLALIKMSLSLVLGFVGVALLQTGLGQRHPEVELDMIRREVRLVRQQGGKRVAVARCAFAKLNHVEHNGSRLRMWDARGGFLAEVDMCDKATQINLTRALREAGKLA